MGWFAANWQEVIALALEHLLLSVGSVAIAVLLAVPVAVWAHGDPRRARLVTGTAAGLYTVPSLALFALLVPVVGLGPLPALIGLVAYAQLTLVRAVLDGLDAVPDEVRDAAKGMGVAPFDVLREIDLPLALPIALSGVRIATVTVIGIATIGAVIDAGGLGELILQGLQQDYATKVVIGAVSVSSLAIGADAVLAWVERRARPWAVAR